VRDKDHVATAQAVYDAAAEAYVRFVGTEVSAATEGPIDRSLLAAFVELMTEAPTARVADVGCGPGRVAGLLADHGIEVIGVDVSSAMLAVARTAHPGIQFEEGRLTALPIADASLAGAVCWYSIIHTPPEHLDDVCTELQRVLAPNGYLLLAFQAGNGEGLLRADAYATQLPLTTYRHAPDEVVRRLTEAGLQVRARAVREPEFAHESTPQAFIIARANRLSR
jgi:ubiquinone/menaquinone biosynthesis C-methylase UbiE